LGSGLGNITEQLVVHLTVPFSNIPGMPTTSVDGHSGNFIFAEHEGHFVIFMQGRLHFYEGYDMTQIVFPIRLMKLLGVKRLIVSNASGGLNPDYERGDLMLIRDHINLFPTNPLIGRNDESFGPRFPDFSEPYNQVLNDKTQIYAEGEGIKIHQGVYVGLSGPCLETPAEYRFLRIIGGDSVGMSTIPEVITAVHCGMSVSGISVITDLGVEGKIRKVTFDEIKGIADSAAPKVSKLVKFMIEN
jgi:purine-nucleoside phosphorylase